MSEAVEDLAARLGIRLPNSSPVSRPPSKEAPRQEPGGFKNKGPTCRRGHPYGPHKKTCRSKGKTYEVRYCRKCATDAERRRRQAKP